MTTDPDDDQTMQQVTDKLAEKYPNTPRQTLEDAVREEFADLAGRPVRDYLFILTERAAKKRLKRSGELER